MAPKGRSMGKMNASAPPPHIATIRAPILSIQPRVLERVLFAPDFEPSAVLSAGEQWLSLDNYAAVIRCLRLHTLGELILYSRHLMSLANRAIMQHFLCRPKGGPWSQIAPEHR